MKSLRRSILEAMRDAFRAVDMPDPDDTTTLGDWPLKFSTVEIGPLGDSDHRKRFSIGIVPQAEAYGDLHPFITRNLRVGIEFRVTVNRGDEAPALMAEEVLTVVERVVMSNRSWGGLALDTKFMGNETDMTDYDDKTVYGVLFVEVSYRHGQDDPRNTDATFGS